MGPRKRLGSCLEPNLPAEPATSPPPVSRYSLLPCYPAWQYNKPCPVWKDAAPIGDRCRSRVRRFAQGSCRRHARGCLQGRCTRIPVWGVNCPRFLPRRQTPSLRRFPPRWFTAPGDSGRRVLLVKSLPGFVVVAVFFCASFPARQLPGSHSPEIAGAEPASGPWPSVKRVEREDQPRRLGGSLTAIPGSVWWP